MRICPKCLECYGSSFDLYCRFDGSKTFDVTTIEAEEAVRKLKKRISKDEKSVWDRFF